MATVRFSFNLKGRILREARKVFVERIDKVTEDYPNWGPDIYDLMFASTKDQMLALPEGYFSRNDFLGLAGFDGGGWDSSLNLPVVMELSQKMPFPDTKKGELHGTCEGGRMGIGLLLNANDPRWGNIKREYRTYCEAVRDITNHATAFEDGVKRVLRTYATLSPALRAWPALWDLIPEDVRERHREVKPRSKASDQKAELDAAVDLDSLTGSVAARKLTR